MLEIAQDVWQVPVLGGNAINTYLVGDVLVDTGIKQSAGKITQALGGRTLSAIALTHAHGDHAGSLKQLAARFGAPVWCGAADVEATETGRIVPAQLLSRLHLGGIANAMAGFDGTPVTRSLAEDDELSAGFVVLDTPGHSPGHISLWRESDRTLICGDVFFNLKFPTPVRGLRQPPDLFTPDPARNRASERRLAALNPVTVGFGHGPVMRGDAAQLLNEFVASLPGE